MAPTAQETAQGLRRLAQVLEDNPTLVSSWPDPVVTVTCGSVREVLAWGSALPASMVEDGDGFRVATCLAEGLRVHVHWPHDGPVRQRRVEERLLIDIREGRKRVVEG